MTSREILELAIAAICIVAGIWLYRRPTPGPDHYGSQGAVLLFVVAAILIVHGTGLLRYKPTPAEIESARR